MIGYRILTESAREASRQEYEGDSDDDSAAGAREEDGGASSTSAATAAAAAAGAQGRARLTAKGQDTGSAGKARHRAGKASAAT